VVEILDAVDDAESGSHGAFGIVFVRDRGPEDAHHRVTYELLTEASEAFDLLAQASLVRGEGRNYVLGIGPVRTCGEIHDVDEKNRDNLAFFAFKAAIRL
jgi:hypothetical protein